MPVLNLVVNLVVAVLRDSVCVCHCVADLSVVYIACKVERFVSIILNEDYYIILLNALEGRRDSKSFTLIGFTTSDYKCLIK